MNRGEGRGRVRGEERREGKGREDEERGGGWTGREVAGYSDSDRVLGSICTTHISAHLILP
jgi:hypothetical protein